MNRLRGVGRFWWDFVIGDDWRLAVGGGVALAATGILTHADRTAWWVAPTVIVAVLVGTLAAARPRHHKH